MEKDKKKEPSRQKNISASQFEWIYDDDEEISKEKARRRNDIEQVLGREETNVTLFEEDDSPLFSRKFLSVKGDTDTKSQVETKSQNVSSPVEKSMCSYTWPYTTPKLARRDSNPWGLILDSESEMRGKDMVSNELIANAGTFDYAAERELLMSFSQATTDVEDDFSNAAYYHSKISKGNLRKAVLTRVEHYVESEPEAKKAPLEELYKLVASKENLKTVLDEVLRRNSSISREVSDEKDFPGTSHRVEKKGNTDKRDFPETHHQIENSGNKGIPRDIDGPKKDPGSLKGRKDIGIQCGVDDMKVDPRSLKKRKDVGIQCRIDNNYRGSKGKKDVGIQCAPDDLNKNKKNIGHSKTQKLDFEVQCVIEASRRNKIEALERPGGLKERKNTGVQCDYIDSKDAINGTCHLERSGNLEGEKNNLISNLTLVSAQQSQVVSALEGWNPPIVRACPVMPRYDESASEEGDPKADQTEGSYKGSHPEENLDYSACTKHVTLGNMEDKIKPVNEALVSTEVRIETSRSEDKKYQGKLSELKTDDLYKLQLAIFQVIIYRSIPDPEDVILFEEIIEELARRGEKPSRRHSI